MSQTLKGKKAVVTGAGRGIGRSIALAFAREGADIAICARSQDALDDTAQAIKAFGVDCLWMPVDIADERAVSRFTEKVEQTFGQVNILVNNAGVYLDQGRFEDSDPEQWWTTIEINIKGPYLITRHLVSAMPEGSKILNLSSGKGFSAGQNSSARSSNCLISDWRTNRSGVLARSPPALTSSMWGNVSVGFCKIIRILKSVYTQCQGLCSAARKPSLVTVDSWFQLLRW